MKMKMMTLIKGQKKLIFHFKKIENYIMTTFKQLTNSGAGAVTTILDMANVPTIKQLKNTTAFKQSSAAFKHISLHMFSHMKRLKNDNTNTTKSIVNSVFNGYKIEKAKNILISIARNVIENTKKNESIKTVAIEPIVTIIPSIEIESEDDVPDSWEDIDTEEIVEEEIVETPKPKNAWGVTERKVYTLTFEDQVKCEPVSVCVPVVSKPKSFPKSVPVYCKSVKEDRMQFTMLCRHHFHSGGSRCRRGENCNFAHSIAQWKPNVCRFKHKCNKGDNCRWFHPERETKEEFAKRQRLI